MDLKKADRPDLEQLKMSSLYIIKYRTKTWPLVYCTLALHDIAATFMAYTQITVIQ
jgi:hypothetical protein